MIVDLLLSLLLLLLLLLLSKLQIVILPSIAPKAKVDLSVVVVSASIVDKLVINLPVFTKALYWLLLGMLGMLGIVSWIVFQAKIHPSLDALIRIFGSIELNWQPTTSKLCPMYSFIVLDVFLKSQSLIVDPMIYYNNVRL